MEIVNRVAESDIIVYNLDELWDDKEVVEVDISPFLMEGLVLREVSFRNSVKEHPWSDYQDKHVAIHCSTDAIVPTWAFMLIATRLEGIAASVAHGRAEDLIRDHFARALEAEDWSRFEGKPVVVKGCGGRIVPTNAYLVATRKLQETAGKLMFGEPCSSVPLWRKPRAQAPRPKGVARPAGPPSLRAGGVKE